MTTLVWGVKASLLAYVRAQEGEITVDGAEESPEGFVFPGSDAGDLRFTGSVTLVAHGGMMNVVLRDPAIERSGEGATLTIVDPFEPEQRMPFAHILRVSDDGQTLTASGTVLTMEGSDLFVGPYGPGTAFDDPVVHRGDASGAASAL